jgi:hypothetical protein
MATLITIAVATYCIVVVFIMIEKKIHAIPASKNKESEQDNNAWIDSYEQGHKWLNFASGLSDTPSSEIPCRPLDK